MPKPQPLHKKKIEPASARWVRLGLALTLVPIIIGLILMIAWVLDYNLTGSLENQGLVGMAFLLASFALSNLLQKRWNLLIGWVLLLVSNLITLLFPTELMMQIISLVLLLGALAMLGTEYFHRIRENAEANKN
jgi:hypothetical protein